VCLPADASMCKPSRRCPTAPRTTACLPRECKSPNYSLSTLHRLCCSTPVHSAACCCSTRPSHTQRTGMAKALVSPGMLGTQYALAEALCGAHSTLHMDARTGSASPTPVPSARSCCSTRASHIQRGHRPLFRWCLQIRRGASGGALPLPTSAGHGDKVLVVPDARELCSRLVRARRRGWGNDVAERGGRADAGAAMRARAAPVWPAGASGTGVGPLGAGGLTGRASMERRWQGAGT
jgi:hypothetical protein